MNITIEMLMENEEQMDRSNKLPAGVCLYLSGCFIFLSIRGVVTGTSWIIGRHINVSC